MAWTAGIITVAVGIVALAGGYRVSARWLKNDPPYKLADQADTLPEAAGLVGLLLPRSLKAIWVALCVLAGLTLIGAVHFFALGGAFTAYRTHGLIMTSLVYLGALVLWGGMMFGCGTVYERIVRGCKLSP